MCRFPNVAITKFANNSQLYWKFCDDYISIKLIIIDTQTCSQSAIKLMIMEKNGEKN